MHLQRIGVLAVLAFAAAGFGAAEARTHTVSAGETLASIARSEHVSLPDLARLNQLEGAARHKLSPGQELALDEPAASKAAPVAEQPAEAAAELAKAEAGNAPKAGADAAMWGAGEGSASPLRKLASRFIKRTSAIATSLTRSAMRFLGTPYVFGGTSASGFDCSGYVQHVFAMLGVRLPRTADAQFYAGNAIHGQMETGDLVFFQTYEPGPSHVGIYLGNGEFVHSSSHGVMVSRLRDSYWAARYIGAKRVASI